MPGAIWNATAKDMTYMRILQTAVYSEKEPLCVQWCITDALTYEEREEEVEEEEEQEEMEIGLEALADKYGLDKIMDTVARMSMKG